MSTGRYVRTQPGGGGYGVIHRAECRMLTGAKHLEGWDWPESKAFEEVLADMRARCQDHFCRMCFPRRDDGGSR